MSMYSKLNCSGDCINAAHSKWLCLFCFFVSWIRRKSFLRYDERRSHIVTNKELLLVFVIKTENDDDKNDDDDNDGDDDTSIYHKGLFQGSSPHHICLFHSRITQVSLSWRRNASLFSEGNYRRRFCIKSWISTKWIGSRRTATVTNGAEKSFEKDADGCHVSWQQWW